MKRRIRIEPPRESGAKALDEQAEVRKYMKLIPGEPEPNWGRVQEIKELLRSGQYPTQEMIEQSASVLAMRFVKGEFGY